MNRQDGFDAECPADVPRVTGGGKDFFDCQSNVTLGGGVMARNMKTPPAVRLGLPADYAEFLESLKARVRQAQTKALLSVDRELIALYRDIGRRIVERQEREGWGKRVVDRLAADIQRAFPGLRGFSASNVSRMRAFYRAYARETAISAQAVPKVTKANAAQAVRQITDDQPPVPLSEIPWGHNVILLFKLSNPAQRLWYAAKTLEHGWSRAVLTVQIESDLYGRQGKAISNFAGTLPAPGTHSPPHVRRAPLALSLCHRQSIPVRPGFVDASRRKTAIECMADS